MARAEIMGHETEKLGLDGAAKCLEELLSVLQNPDAAPSLPTLHVPDLPSPKQAPAKGQQGAWFEAAGGQSDFAVSLPEGPILCGVGPAPPAPSELPLRLPPSTISPPLVAAEVASKPPQIAVEEPPQIAVRDWSVSQSELAALEVQDEMLMSPQASIVLARTPSSILASPANTMDRSTRLLALVQQREDELAQLRLERSDECHRLRTLLQSREEELAELKAQQLGSRAQELTRNSSANTAEEVEQLRAEMAKLSALYEQELTKTRLLLQQCEEDFAREKTRHSDELEEVHKMLKDREKELADLKTQGIMAKNRRYSPDDIENLDLAMLAVQNENLNLKSELHEKKWSLERLEKQAERDVDDSIAFIKQLALSSARSTLDSFFDMTSTEFLGMGNYGYVMTGICKKSGERVVLKLQSDRWVGPAMTEWAHGSEVGVHPHIVHHIELLMHRDSDNQIKRKLRDAFDNGVLTGKRPKFFPETLFCIAIEYMDRGTLTTFIEKGLLTVHCMSAVTYQIASALAFMHKQKRTHNDIKPDNILLCVGPHGDCLLAKLADLGLADHSLDQQRDRAFFAYTVWCAGLGRPFERCPASHEDRTRACAQFLKAMPAQRRDQDLWRTLHDVIEGLWLGATLTMREVQEMRLFQNLKIRVPGSQQEAAELEVCAKRDIKRRETRRMERWLLSSKTVGLHPEDQDGEDVENSPQFGATWPTGKR